LFFGRECWPLDAVAHLALSDPGDALAAVADAATTA
jgi:hypothetical protein